MNHRPLLLPLALLVPLALAACNKPAEPAVEPAATSMAADPAAPPALADTAALLPAYHAIAAEVGCTPSQLAIAWLLHKGPDILPIPGTRSVAHLMDDLGAANVKLSADVMARLEALINQHTVHGARYNAQGTSEVDTEVF